MLNSMSPKSSPLNSIPTSLLKACVSVFSQIIANPANTSFRHGLLPTRFRMAQITPLLKQRELNVDDSVSYQLMMNLNTLSKALEQLILTRITSHSNESASVDCGPVRQVAQQKLLFSKSRVTSWRHSTLACPFLP